MKNVKAKFRNFQILERAKQHSNVGYSNLFDVWCQFSFEWGVWYSLVFFGGELYKDVHEVKTLVKEELFAKNIVWFSFLLEFHSSLYHSDTYNL